jgi:hypothetical protein
VGQDRYGARDRPTVGGRTSELAESDRG